MSIIRCLITFINNNINYSQKIYISGSICVFISDIYGEDITKCLSRYIKINNVNTLNVISTFSVMRSIIFLPSEILYISFVGKSKKENNLWNLERLLSNNNLSSHDSAHCYMLLDNLRLDILNNKHHFSSVLTYILNETHRKKENYYRYGNSDKLDNIDKVITNYHTWIREGIQQELLYINPIRYSTSGYGFIAISGLLFTILNVDYNRNVVRNLLVNERYGLLYPRSRVFIPLYTLLSIANMCRNYFYICDAY